jgi:hypothetical protein
MLLCSWPLILGLYLEERATCALRDQGRIVYQAGKQQEAGYKISEPEFCLPPTPYWIIVWFSFHL